MDEYTADAWHGLLGDLDLQECRDAATAVAKRQPFVAASEIRAEVKRARAAQAERDRTAAVLDPDAYRAQVAAADSAFMRKLAERAGRPLAIKAPPEPDYARRSQ